MPIITQKWAILFVNKIFTDPRGSAGVAAVSHFMFNCYVRCCRSLCYMAAVGGRGPEKKDGGQE